MRDDRSTNIERVKKKERDVIKQNNFTSGNWKKQNEKNIFASKEMSFKCVRVIQFLLEF